MQKYREGTTVHHNPLDIFAWPIASASVTVWPIWPWFGTLWAYAPTPTALYMVVSAAFMLFQMSDKLGMLERFKRRAPPEQPKETEK